VSEEQMPSSLTRGMACAPLEILPQTHTCNKNLQFLSQQYHRLITLAVKALTLMKKEKKTRILKNHFTANKTIP